MTLSTRHLVLAALLHGVLLALLLLSGVQCTPHIDTTPVIQGVLINPNDLKALRPPTPPTPTPPKPEEQDQGPQQIVKDTDVVADQAKAKREKAEAEQRLQEQQKAEQQRQQEAAKAEELKRQQEAQKEVEQAELQKKQQEEAKRKADAAAAAAAEEQRKKDAEAQLRKEAAQEQQAQAAAMAKQKKAEEARQEADRRKRAAELQASLGVESAQLVAQVQNEWKLQLIAALEQAWARPPGTDQSLKAYLRITLAPNGEVQAARIDTGSGVPGFDDSVVRAAYRASPMPLPRDPAAFRAELKICFSPNPRNCE